MAQLPPYWNYLLLILLLLLMMFLWFKQRLEFFEDSYPAYNTTLMYSNEGEKLYERHPIQTSIKADLKAKYKKAYNYEMENEAYRKALFQTFDIKDVCLDQKDWSVVEPLNLALNPKIEQAYTFVIEYIQNKIKTSSAFQLPDMIPVGLNPIQVVHDRLISYQVHRKLPSFILNIEMLLYREAKYHAKEVAMTVRVDKTKGFWAVQVLDATIKGVVFEDQIGLFPVLATDPLNTNQNLSNAVFPEPKFKDRIKDVRFYEYCASNNLDQDQQLQCVKALDLRSLSDEDIQQIRKNPAYV